MVKLKELVTLTKNLNVLYVEDDIHILEALTLYLEKLFLKVDTAQNGQEAIELYKKNSYDLVITDIQMPKMNGIELCKEIRKINENENIIISTAFSDNEYFLESIKIGIDAYILKPVDYEIFNASLFKIANKIKKFKEREEYKNQLEILLTKKSSENLLQQIEISENYEKTLFAFIEMIEKRDNYTGKHSQRVAEYSSKIAKQLGFSKKECKKIYKAAILHDIGKIAIPDSLLLKPTKLKDFEYDLIKEHVNIGFNMLDKIPTFKEIAQIIKAHHEKLDGSGYPNGLKGDEISIESNIMALADTFDAITTSRIYKNKKSVQEALKEIKKFKNIYFKEEIVEAALICLKDIIIDQTINQLPKTSLEKERFSYFYKDSLTEIYNDKYLDVVLTKNIYAKRYKELNLILLDNFGEYNKKNGWTKGDELLINIANRLAQLCEKGTVFRIHGDDFIILQEDEFLKEPLILDLQKYINQFSKDIEVCIQTFDILDKQINSINKLESYL